MEWTSDFIKLYRWLYHRAPSNVGDDSPDTSTWGLPKVHLRKKHCDIDRYFSNQRIVLNLDFCNKPPPLTTYGAEGGICRGIKAPQCSDYVARNPDVFRETFFEIKDIRYFQNTPLASSRTSTHPDLSYAPDPPKIDP